MRSVPASPVRRIALIRRPTCRIVHMTASAMNESMAVLTTNLTASSCSCSETGPSTLESLESEPASVLPLVRLCRGCVPFNTGGGLLDALFAPEESGESRPAPAPGDSRGKVMAWLGPALAAGRRRR